MLIAYGLEYVDQGATATYYWSKCRCNFGYSVDTSISKIIVGYNITPKDMLVFMNLMVLQQQLGGDSI